MDELQSALAPLATDRFAVVWRRSAFERRVEPARPYSRCLALPFWADVDAGGDVWGCSAHLGDARFRHGNLGVDGFAASWRSDARRRHLEWMATGFDPAGCRNNCRLDPANRYLWQLRHPHPHADFI